jgi:outer membrane receptor for ferrienterochelin and colicin
VLIDGRRVAFDPAESTGGGQFVDLNMIPVAAIDRIEVLQDGASAIYGSDAVGGVINIILKKNYNGWEAGATTASRPTPATTRSARATSPAASRTTRPRSRSRVQLQPAQ